MSTARLTIRESESNETTPEEVGALINATELIDLRLDEVHGGPVSGGSSEWKVRLDRLPPQFANLEDGVLLVRVGHELTCDPGDGNETTLSTAHVLTFQITEDLDTTQATLAAWAQTNAYFMVYPYVRQTFTALTSSMGMPPVVLGYMSRDDWPDFTSDAEASDIE